MQKKHKTRLNRNVHWAWQVTTVDCAQIDANSSLLNRGQWLPDRPFESSIQVEFALCKRAHHRLRDLEQLAKAFDRQSESQDANILLTNATAQNFITNNFGCLCEDCEQCNQLRQNGLELAEACFPGATTDPWHKKVQTGSISSGFLQVSPCRNFTVLQESSSVIVVAPFASTFCCFHWSQLHLAGNFTHQWTGNWLLGHLLFRSLGILGKRSHPVEQHSQTSSRRRASCSLMVLFLIWPNPLEHSLQTFGSASPCPTALIVLLSHSNQFSLPCLGICHRLEKNLPLRSHELESLASDESCLDPLLRKEWFYLQNWITSMRWMLIKWWWREYCDSTIWRFNFQLEIMCFAAAKCKQTPKVVSRLNLGPKGQKVHTSNKLQLLLIFRFHCLEIDYRPFIGLEESLSDS